MVRVCKRLVVPKISVHRIPKGKRGTLTTACLIAKLIRSGAKDFYVRQKAIDIFRRSGVRAKDRLGEVRALFAWVRRNVRYTRDIFRVETLHTARRLLELKAGDCDDMTILLGAMLRATGHPVRLALVGFRPDRPHAYTHIYPEVNVKGRWIPIDATVERPMGWAPPAIWKRLWSIDKKEDLCLPKTR